MQRTGAQTFVTGDLTIHGTTLRVRFPVTQLGMRNVSHVGKIAAFETTFTIKRCFLEANARLIERGLELDGRNASVVVEPHGAHDIEFVAVARIGVDD